MSELGGGQGAGEKCGRPSAAKRLTKASRKHRVSLTISSLKRALVHSSESVTVPRHISFIGSHTTIVSARKDADNENSNVTTAAMGVTPH